MGKRTQIAVTCTVLLFGGGAIYPEMASAQSAAETQAYAIPAKDLNSALRQFSQQSRVQLIYPTELTDHKQSAGLSGSYTAAEALRLLLQGSGLQAERVNDRTMVIKPADVPAKEPKTGARGADLKPSEDAPTTLQ